MFEDYGLYEVVRTNFSANFFWIFAIFDRHFSEFVAPSTNQNENYVVRLKRNLFWKKTPKTLSKLAYKRQHNAWSNYTPLERTVRRTLSVTKKTNKHHIFAPTAGTHCAIFPKLCAVIELVETIKKGGTIFRSNV